LPAEDTKTVRRLAFSEDGRFLLGLNDSGSALFWDLVPAVPVRFKPSVGESQLCTLSENGRWLFAIDRVGMGQVWDLKTWTPMNPPQQMKNHVTAAAVNAEGRRLALFAPDSGLQLVDAFTGRALTNPAQPRQAVRRVGFGAREESIFAVGADHELHLWPIESGMEFDVSPRDGGPITFAGFNANRRLLVAGNGLGARVWDVQTGLPVTPPLRQGGPLAAATFDDDGKRLATVSQDGMVCVWELPHPPQEDESLAPEEGAAVLAPVSVDLENGAKVRVEKAQLHGELRLPRPANGMVDRVVFSPDGRLVVVAAADNTAQIWDTATGKQASPPLRHLAAVVWAAFSPDGRRLLTGSAEGTARVWNVETGQPLAPAFRQARAIRDVFFRDAGKQAVVVYQGLAAALDLRPEEHTAADVRALAQLLACQRINDRQQEEPLAEQDVVNLWETRHPGK
jgi:WD40 repeat protein